MIEMAAHLMRNPDAFEAACRQVLTDWPNSVAAALTTPSMNYEAWMGHAAGAITLGASEDLMRQGWRLLTEAEQLAANAAALVVIDEWRAANA